MRNILLVLMCFLMLSTKANAIILECSDYPLMSIPDRAALTAAIERLREGGKIVEPDKNFKDLKTVEKLHICKGLANGVRAVLDREDALKGVNYQRIKRIEENLK